MCDVVFDFAASVATPNSPPPISSGIKIVAIKNPLVLIRSVYSRFAISQTLCIDDTSSFLVTKTRAHAFNKDLFQRRLLHIEPMNHGAPRLPLGPHLLRACLAVQLQFRTPRIVLGFFHLRVLQEQLIP